MKKRPTDPHNWNFANALARLQRHVHTDRMEYPTAHERVCEEFKLSTEEGEALTARYDSIEAENQD